MSRADKHHSKGFTLVELMLAMAFISVLMIVIAMTVIQIGNIYNKGLTMKAVNQAGRSISTDMRLILSQSQPFNLGTAYRTLSNPGNTTDGGRLCTGVYTYVWNYGKSLDNPINKYDGINSKIRFARVQDNGGKYCANQSLNIKPSDATELLSSGSVGDRDLAIQSFAIESVASDARIGQELYKISMEIGTNNRESLAEALNTMDTTCKPPIEVTTLQNFCAVNRFEFTAQAGNKGVQ